MAGDVPGGEGMRMTRKVHLTGAIKPSTREAMLDQLAAIADGIIRQRSTWWARFERWWQA